MFGDYKPLTLYLCPVMPHLLEDSRKIMERWGASGKFDPFEKIYEVCVSIYSIIELPLTRAITYSSNFFFL
jgi:hypothetical protein